ncbi:class I SAM-dependent methyltransferase [Clostridiaceae bacterium M8S5]|nr:class I SAM-dependent methyltransferase [Clostridiaceae bacterium M8S5]
MKKYDIKCNWNKMAMAYEVFTNARNSYSNMIEWPAIEKLMPNLNNKVVIDLGCGTGRFSFLFEQYKPVKVTGIDISEEMITLAKEKALSKGSRVNFIKGDIENLSQIDTNSVDLVFSFTVLHYLKDLNSFMKEVHRILKIGGICILSVIHPVYSAQYPLKHKDGAFPKDEEWKVRYLCKSERTYIQPWIEYNSDIDNFLSSSYHHTMGDYINSIIRAGFILKEFVEPMPPIEWKQGNKVRYEGFLDTPTYGIFELQK